MANHRSRNYAPAHQQARQRVLDTEEGRLGKPGLSQFLVACFRGINCFTNIQPQMRLEQSSTLVDFLTEQRLPLIELVSHADMLRSLTWKQKDDAVQGWRSGDGWTLDILKGTDRLFDIPAHRKATTRKGAPPDCQRESRICQRPRR